MPGRYYRSWSTVRLMETATETPAANKARKPWLFTPETSLAARERRKQLREERRARKPMQRAENAAALAIESYTPRLPALDDASRELLPKILSDEITWRSELLATVRRAEKRLLDAINLEMYDATKQTLPQLATALVKVVEMSERIVERTKALDLTGQSTQQVSGLFAKYAVLRRELQARGLMDEHGRLKTPQGQEAETASEAPGDTISPDTVPEEGSGPDLSADSQGDASAADRAKPRGWELRYTDANGVTRYPVREQFEAGDAAPPAEEEGV